MHCWVILLKRVAGVTGLEPAASGVTGRGLIPIVRDFSNFSAQIPTRYSPMGYGWQFERRWRDNWEQAQGLFKPLQVIVALLSRWTVRGHLFPSDDHKAAMDMIAGELME
jgi:hypothetical protein